MRSLTRLASETATYGLGTIVPRLINYFLVVPHTRIFEPEAYGVITNLYAYAGFLNVLFLFGMETAFFRFANKPGASVDQVFRLTQTLVLAVSVSLSVVLLAFAQPLATAWGLAGKTEYVYYLVGIILIDAVVALPFARWRQEKKALLFSLTKIINVIVLVGINYFFLFYRFDPAVGVAYVFIANLLANALFFIFHLPGLLRWRPVWHRALSPALFRYAYPVMFTGLAGLTHELFSRVAIQWWWPPDFQGQSAQHALGVFGACYKYAVFMSLAVMAFRYAAEPFFFSRASDKESAALFARVNHYFVVVGSFIVLAVTVNLGWLKWMLGATAYHEGLDVVLILLVAYLFTGVYYNFSIWFKLTDRTHFGTWFTVGGAVITVAGNYLLIPIAGYYGSAWVTLLASAAMMAACYAVGQRLYPIPYPIAKSVAYLALACLLVFVSSRIVFAAGWVNTLWHQALCVVYLVTVWVAERKEFSRHAT